MEDEVKLCKRGHPRTPENVNKRGECRECGYARTRIYRKAHPDKVRAFDRAWRKANPEKVRAWKKANPEKVRAYMRAWQKANPEKVRAYMRAWKKANPEKVRAYMRAWKKANPERVRARCRAQYRANPDKKRAIKQRRRAIKNNAEGSFTAQEFVLLKELCDNRCVCCGRELPLTADHIIPLSCGGSNYLSNLQSLCMSCNCSKFTKAIDYLADKVLDFIRLVWTEQDSSNWASSWCTCLY